MSKCWEQLRTTLAAAPRRWVVTGAAGFIGSNLVERLLELNQQVVGVDNFSTGRQGNLEQVRSLVSAQQWTRFEFIKGDICEDTVCRRACSGAQIILHQAGINSAPRSLDDPVLCHATNVTGMLQLLIAARDASVGRFVYASSSTVYGDEPTLPKVEERIGLPISPYGATKQMAEMYAGVFARSWGYSTIGLRYFNVFGPRQYADSAYAAVIPKWLASLIQHEPVFINGDGETSRDFCFIDNVVQANLLAGAVTDADALNQVYNIAVGGRTTLNELFAALKAGLEPRDPAVASAKPTYRDFRAGDVRHSLADIGKARRLLGYEPQFDLQAGLARAFDWYLANLNQP